MQCAATHDLLHQSCTGTAAEMPDLCARLAVYGAGWPEDVASLGRRELNNFHSTHYTPANMTIAVVGDVDPVQVCLVHHSMLPLASAGKPVIERQLSCSPTLSSGHLDASNVHAAFESLTQLLHVLAGAAARRHLFWALGSRLTARSVQCCNLGQADL